MSADNFNDDDDDFGDFGGFEAAEPIDPQQAQPVAGGIQASPSPWAVIPGAASSAQPGVQSETSAVQQSTESHSVQGSENVSGNQASGDTNSETFQGFQTFGQAAGTGSSVTEGLNAELSQIGASSDNSSKLVGAFDDALAESEEERSSSQRYDVKENKTTSPSVKSSLNAAKTDSTPAGKDGTESAQVKANNEAAKHLSRLQDKLKLTEQDRSKLQKELEEVQGLQKQLQTELVQLHEQTARYEQMQSKHALQLDEMRKAGHDALVLIVEEYKELCKTAVLQQQEASQRELQEYLKEQAEKEEKKQKQREEEISRVLESERSKFEKRLEEELCKLEEKHKTEMKLTIVAENEKTEEMIKKAIEAEKDKSTAGIEKAVEEERNKTRQTLEEQKAEFLKLLEEERQNSKKMLKNYREEEKDKLERSIKGAVEQERENGDKIQQEIKAQIKSDLEHYVKEQKQEDLLIRKRQLASMDLFLESARGQLKLLMGDVETTTENS